MDLELVLKAKSSKDLRAETDAELEIPDPDGDEMEKAVAENSKCMSRPE